MRKNVIWLIVIVISVLIILAILLGRQKPESPTIRIMGTPTPRSASTPNTTSPKANTAAEIVPAPAVPQAIQPAPQEASIAPAAADMPPELAGKQTPVWGITVPVVEGQGHKYQFILDGKKTDDPLNKAKRAIFNECLFAIPPAADHTAPRLLPGGRAEFFCEGPIKQRLWLMGEWRGDMWWTIDEFQPLNDAARKNLEEVKTSKDLSFLQGIVIDSSRKPVPRARVRFVNGMDHMGVAECDTYGHFRMDRLPLTELTVTARAWGFKDATPIKARILADGQAKPIELTLEPAAVVMGTVRDEGGKPLVHASVSAHSGKTHFLFAPTVFTDAMGRYVHANLEAGKYSLMASHPNHATGSKTGIALEAGKKPLQIDFVLNAGGTISGKVIQDVAGEDKGVADVQIGLHGSPVDAGGIMAENAYIHVNATSKEDGTFLAEHVPLDSKFGSALFEKGGIKGGQSIDVTMKQGTQPEPLILRLPAAGRILGRVLSADQKPVADAGIYLLEGMNPNGNYERIDMGLKEKFKRATSDQEGKFTIDNVAQGSQYTFFAEAAGFAPTMSDRISISGETEMEIVMKHGGSISGRVILADTKAPLAKAQVRARPDSNPMTLQPNMATKDDGTFEFTNLSEGNWGLGGDQNSGGNLTVIEPKGNVKVAEGQRTENVELLAYAALEISGKVLMNENKQPVPAAYVNIMRKNPENGRMTGMDSGLGTGWGSQTDTAGQFRVTNAAPGVYTVSANKDGFLQSEQKEITLEKGKSAQNIEILLGQGGSISGVVVDAGDKPVSQTQVVADMQRDPMGGYYYNGYQNRQTSDTSGKFVLTGLPLDKGQFRIVTYPGSQNIYGASEYVKITTEKPTAEVTVRLQSGGSISGTVKDRSGKPLAGVNLQVYVSNPTGSYGFGRSATTNAQGTYVLKNLPAGEYNMQIQKEKYARQSREKVALKVGQNLEGMDFTLDASVAVKGILVDLNMKKLGGWRVSAQIESQEQGGQSRSVGSDLLTDSAGRFKLEGLAQGDKFRLNFYFDGQRTMMYSGGQSSQGYRNCTYRSGIVAHSEEEMIFVLATGGVIKGRVLVEGTNQPVKDARMDLYYRQDGPTPDPQGTKCVLQNFNINSMQAVKPDGTFAIADLPVGNYNLNIRSDTTTNKQLDLVSIDTTLLTDLKDIFLGSGCVVTGRLIDSSTGKPYTRNGMMWNYGMGISVKRSSGQGSSGVSTEMNDTSGQFRATGVPPDASEFSFRVNGFLPISVKSPQLTTAKPNNIGDVRLLPGETIQGKLLSSSGEPARNAQINLDYQYMNEHAMQYGRTDNEGAFVIKGVAPGQAKLRAYANNREGNPWIDTQRNMAEIQEYAITVPQGGVKNLEIRFPAQVPATATPTPGIRR